MFNDDVRNRPMIKDIHTNFAQLSSFELGKHGFSFRNITPLFYKDSYIGALEIGVNPKKILDQVSFFNNTDGVLKFNSYNGVVTFENIKNEAVLKIVNETNYNLNQIDKYKIDNKVFAIYTFNINNFKDKNIAQYSFFQDLTPFYDNYYNALTKMTFIFLMSLLISFIVLRYVFEEYSKNLKKLTSKADTILNAQNNIVVVTNNGEEIIEVNKAFLEFFNFNELKCFKEKYECICDHFIEDKGYLSKIVNNQT